jgi:feruloyl esterase
MHGNPALYLVFLGFTFASPLIGDACDELRSLALAHTSITTAETVAAGDFSLPARRDGVKPPSLPSFCRVTAILRPSNDSNIRVEIWLPVSGWNGKIEANGNGGWTGSISPSALATGLVRGYATAMSDLGHEGSSAEFALGHPEKLIDYGYRAAHEMTVTTKAIVASYYGRAAKRSYWTGCSAGGRSALMEAQRYPNDFDGIIAGSPGLNWTGRATQAIWIAQAAHKDEASYIPPEKYALIHKAVLQACDSLDGLSDGVLEDPARCHFDPRKLQCKGSDTAGCLSEPQVQTALAIYAAVVDPDTKQPIFHGFQRGSELGWRTMGGPRPFQIGVDFFRYVIFRKPDWDYKTFRFDADLALIDRDTQAILNATDPNLRPFIEHGGKMIQYHGWNDPQIEPASSVAYYQSVLKALGGAGAVQSSYRLFMVPGMAHCGGGEGASNFDMLAALENWAERGISPDRIEAWRVREGKIDRRRPLCPYPQVPVYRGSGDADDALNFVCKQPGL